jgi:hypothetical protein
VGVPSRRPRLAIVAAALIAVQALTVGAANAAQQARSTTPVGAAVKTVPPPAARLTMVAPGNNNFTDFAATSENGAHVLISTTGTLTPGPTDGHLKLYDAIAGRFLLTGGTAGHVYYEDMTPDGGALLFTSTEALVPADQDQWNDLYLTDSAGTHLVSVGTADAQMQAMFLADNASVVLFETREAILPEDTDNSFDLYRWSATTGEVTLVSPGVAVDAWFAGASADGTRIFIQVDQVVGGTSYSNLFEYTVNGLVKFGDGGPIWISADNAHVYFRSENSYVASDTDGLLDGYEWSAAGYRLMSDPSVGWTSLYAMSDSGTSWIMTAMEALTADDTDAALDVYLVTPLGPMLVSQGATDAEFIGATKDLSVIVYDTVASLVPEDTDGDHDIYRWDAARPGQVDLVSGGAAASAIGGPARLVAMDPPGSSLILSTSEAIDPQDTDTSVDIYRWTAAGRSLLSPGSSLPVIYGGASLDTGRVFFNTDAKLDASDTNDSSDVYVSDLDTTPPIPTIAGPTGTSGPDVTIQVATQDADAVWFDCQLDTGPWEQCGPTVDLTNLASGPHTESVNAYDAAANRSSQPATLTWTVSGGGGTDIVPPLGTVSIADGATWTNTPLVDVATSATDATSGVSEVALSNDGTTWTTRAYAAIQAWTLPSTNGTHTVWVKWRDGAGNWSDPVSDTIVLDTLAPTATTPTKALILGSTLSASKPTLRFAWAGSDAGSGIGHYEFALSTDGGAYATMSSALTSPTLSRALAPGHSYRARVRARDVAGNVGAWAYGSAFRLTAYQESSSAIHWTGTWHTGSNTSFLGGHDRYSTTAGAKASLTFTGRSFGWVGSVGPSRGWAKVYVNGVLVKSVNLYAATSAHRRVLFSTSWSSPVSRTVTIRISGTASHPRGDVDAFVVGS